MTALAANKNYKVRPADLAEYPVAASTHIYKGAAVCLNAGGYLVPAAKTAGFSEVVGVAVEEQNNTSVTDGAKECMVESGVIAYFTAVGGAAAQLGNNAYAIDDATVAAVGGAGVTSLSPFVGRIMEVVSSTQLGVFIPKAGGGGLRSEIEVGLVAGGAAGDHVLAGISLGDRIVFVGHFTTAAAIATLADLTAEFTVTAADTINNATGTDTTNDQLMVVYEKRG